MNTAIGRFCQYDPLTNAESLNNYRFVRNSSINNVDPSGYLTLNGGVSMNVCVDNNGPTISNPPYNGPTISNPPYDGPTISNPPYNGPTISNPPSEQSNPPKNMPNLNTEAGGCIAEGVGICASIKRGVDSNGNLYEGIEFSPVAGIGASGSVSGSLGNDDPSYGFDCGFKLRLDGEAGGASANFTGTYSTMHGSGESSMSVGAYGAGATVNTNGTGNVNASFGGGASATVGPYFSWTWKVK